jgi:hypothetical protein
MRRRKRITRFIFRGLATAAIGGFLGFLVPQVIADLSPKPEQQFPAPESPVARQFIDAFTSDDQDALTEMQVSADMKARAARLRSDFQRVDTPVHLGSYVGYGGETVHAYAADAVNADGTPTMLGWRLATSGGGMVLVPPPQTIEAP